MPRVFELPLPVLDALPLGAHRLIALTDEALFDACGVRVAFTSREGGVSSGPFASLNCAGHVGDDPACVKRNREIVCEAVGVRPDSLVVPSQVHGTDIVRATGPGNPEADAVLAIDAGIPVLMNFADCLPLIIVAPTGAFVVVHAGWRGAVGHIAKAAASELASASGCAPGGFNAYIGPHIHAGCFEVGEEVEERFRAEFGGSVIEAPRHVSLSRAVRVDLASAGLEPERIADADICTKCNSDQYFSYRATDGTCGRISAVAVREMSRPAPGDLTRLK